MNLEQYKVQKKELNNQHIAAIRELNQKYAETNAALKVGDIAEDHIGKILVEKIVWYNGSGTDGIPDITYYGRTLKKDGMPTKKEDRRNVWQSNLNPRQPKTPIP